MAKAAKKLEPRKGPGHMEVPPSLLAAVAAMDLKKVRDCLDVNPSLIDEMDDQDNNAMHLCIAGGSPRVWDIVKFLAEETNINLLQKNTSGDTPIDVAIAMNDRKAADYLYGPTVRQLAEAHPDPKPELK